MGINLFQYIQLDQATQTDFENKLPCNVNLFRAGTIADNLFDLYAKCHITFGNVPADWLNKSSTLKWIQLESVGYEPYLDMLSGFGGREITITNLQGFFGKPVVESALAGVLSLMRGTDKLVLLKEKSRWTGTSLRPGLTLLHDATVLIVGGGNIGQSFRKLLAGFDTKTTVFDKNPEYADITSVDAFDRLLPHADVIFSCLPENHETTCFFNEERFSRMKSSAIFVNVGRGTVVDESVLISKLRNKDIGGAVLDVTCEEPLPADHPLWECPNLIMTQHTGGGSREELKGKVSVFLENLALYMAGKPLKRVVKITSII